MRKIYYWILLTALPITLGSCQQTSESQTENSSSTSNSEVVEGPVFSDDMYYVKPEVDPHFHKNVSDFSSPSDVIETSYRDAFEDKSGLIKKSDITYGETYINGNRVELGTAISPQEDGYNIFYGANQARVIGRAKGFALTLPTSTTIEPNLDESKYRAQFSTQDYTLTVTVEDQNPYGDWATYHDEWLTRYIVGDKTNYGVKRYIENNNLEYVRDNILTTSLLNGFETELVSILIKDNAEIEKPYYNIGIIRAKNSVKKFTLLVMKSKMDMSNQFSKIVASYSGINKYGQSYKGDKFELKVPSYLSHETQKYYKQLMEQNYTEWGIFSHSMYDTGSAQANIKEDNDFFEQSMDYKFGLAPTYTHCGKAYDPGKFPLESANMFAGGNGENGKPVLQFTMQYTSSNNLGLSDYTPMFDIIRGKYDQYFKDLAASLKEYSKPVLFRLNNEMNSDWVSYCGMVTLLDPDIFAMTWERMARIFVEEGVDNVLYIFNPTGKTFPYCNWGEDLCYLPSLEYVQILGLTVYEYNNYTDGSYPVSFFDLYENLYEKNSPYWVDYPAIISEFACGAGGNDPAAGGGELYRNSLTQAAWVEEMFEYLNYCREDFAFIDQIKGAVWFNANDDNGRYHKNLLVLDAVKTKTTIDAFKIGLADTDKLRNGESLQ